ncbi:hypothetical protein ACFLYQ_05880 [Chloroflexota bacterium]
MATDIDLKVIKRKVYMTYFQDGWWDILLGCFLLSWGLVFQFDFVMLPSLVFITLFSITWPVKKWLTYPRIGHAKISEERRQQVKIVIAGVVTLLLGIMAFLSFSLGSRPSWLSEYFMILFSAMLAIVICLLALWWNIRWWYAYAAILMITTSFHQWLGASLPLSYIIPGVIIIVTGLIMLMRFLRKYPKMPEGVADDVSR